MFWALATLALTRVDVDMVVVVYLDGDGDVEVDATVDGPSIFVSMATTPSSKRPPRSYCASLRSLRSFMTSRDAAHSMASPRAIL